jgi:hypothetical protein
MDASLWRQQFYVATLTSTNVRGDDTHGTPVAYPCRFEPNARTLKDVNGFQVISSGVIFCGVVPGPSDLIWPPGANQASAAAGFKPLRVDRHFDPDSGLLSFVEVTF